MHVNGREEEGGQDGSVWYSTDDTDTPCLLILKNCPNCLSSPNCSHAGKAVENEPIKKRSHNCEKEDCTFNNNSTPSGKCCRLWLKKVVRNREEYLENRRGEDVFTFFPPESDIIGCFFSF